MKIKTDGILFDIDGTLWDSVPGVTDAWNQEIRRQGYSYHLTVDMMRPLFGQKADRFGDVLFSDLSEEARHKLAYDCAYSQVGSLKENRKAVVYEGVRETMRQLAEIYPLYIVTNADERYVELFKEYAGINPYIQDYECDRGIQHTKADNIRLIIERHALQHPVYVGDTSLDQQSSKEAGASFIWASYGLEAGVDSEWSIRSIRELPDKLERI